MKTVLAVLAAAALAAPANASDLGLGLVDELLVTADRLVIDDGVITADGHVQLTLDGRIVDAERLRLVRETGLLALERGAWQGPSGALRFESATVPLGEGVTVVLGARFEAPAQHAVVTGAELRVLGPGRLSATDATLGLCTCDPAPWSLSARQIAVEIDGVARLQGGWVSVCERRLIPLPPISVPLEDRRSGLLAPHLGYGQDGVVLGEPLFLVLGPHADTTIEPELRGERGLRGLGELRYALAPQEGGLLQVAAGWDRLTEGGRGALDLEHAWTPGRWRSAVDAQWTSDERVQADYGGDFLARSTPWSEQRALLAWGDHRGALRVDGRSVLMPADALQRPISGVVSAPALSLWGGTLQAEARVDHARFGGAPLPFGEGAQSDPLGLRTQARLELDRGFVLGPTRLVLAGRSRATRWTERPGWVEGGLGAAALLDLWGDLGSLRHVAAVGLVAEVRDRAGASPAEALPAHSLGDDRLPTGWSAGPVLRSRLLDPVGVPLRAELAAPFGTDGFDPVGRLAFTGAPWTVTVEADRRLQLARAALDGAPGRVGVGIAHQASESLDLLQAQGELGWQLPGPLREWRPGWTGLYDLTAERSLNQGPLLAFHSRCQCLSFAAAATWAADRELPDLRLQVDLGP